jgi:NTE family protein
MKNTQKSASEPNIAGGKQTAVTPEQIKARGHRKPVNLALQGGGAHGAFTWGVLDKLLEDDRLALDAVSATSAGAMNAAVMAYGVCQGGNEGARAALERFWRAISDSGATWNPLRVMPWDSWLAAGPFGSGPSPSYMMFDALTHVMSPYQLNPMNFNPLREVLENVVDFEELSRCDHATRLFISATNVRTGKIRVFENAEISADAIMASACLPYVFKAVQIGTEHYWDGGFMGNPAIFPLIYQGASNDVIVVHVNPLTRKLLPRSAAEIVDRMNEISFNSSLMREMRAIAFVSKLLDEEKLDSDRYSRMHIHSIRNDDEMAKYGLESKLDPGWKFLSHLRDIGRETAAEWLETTFHHVGHKTTIDMTEMYL